MDWLFQIVKGILGGVMLYYGAEFLVRGGVSIALKFKISPLVIGLTLVAFATSAPELVVSLTSSLQGHGDVAYGNVIGSNICNIALILGLSAAISPLPVNKKLLKLDMPLMVGASALLILFYLMNRGVNRWQGLLFFAGIIAYTAWSVYKSRKEGMAESDGGDEVEIKEVNIWFSLLLVAGGLATLVLGAEFFIKCAVFIAGKLGVPEAIIGLTIVAFGTSLPELATSLVAALKHEQDIAIGNVVGSNIFNILSIMGISPLCCPIYAPGVKTVDMAVMFGIAAGLWGMMIFCKKLGRTAGIALLTVNTVYIVYLVIQVLPR